MNFEFAENVRSLNVVEFECKLRHIPRTEWVLVHICVHVCVCLCAGAAEFQDHGLQPAAWCSQTEDWVRFSQTYVFHGCLFYVSLCLPLLSSLSLINQLHISAVLLIIFLSSSRQHPSYGDFLEVKREYYQNYSVLDCVTQCSQSAAHLCEQFLQVQQIGFVTLGPLRCA